MAGRRFALLIATYRYQDAGLRRLLSPAQDALALAQVLRDPAIAGFEVTTLVNEPHHVVGAAIGRFFRERRRDDLALLYFTGHGVKDDDGRLYLAMSDTQRESLVFTGLSADQLNYAMESCLSRQKVLVLDCCYSGSFPEGRATKGDAEVHTLERFQGRGRAVLTASDSTQYSFERDRLSGEGVRSVFTHFLIEGIETGQADLDGDGDISLDELYSYVHERVIDEMPQQRPKKQENVEGRIVLAQNVHWTLPAYVANAAVSPIASERLAAVEALAHLYRIGNAVVREGVLAQTRRLAGDDSTMVSAAGAALLRTAAEGSGAPDDSGPPHAEASGPVVGRSGTLRPVWPVPLAETPGADLPVAGAEAASETSPRRRLPPAVPPGPRPARRSPLATLESIRRSGRRRPGARRGRTAVLAAGLAVVALVAVTTFLRGNGAVRSATALSPSPSVPAPASAPVTTSGSPAATPPVRPSSATPHVVGVIKVGSRPGDVVVAPNGQYAYVANTAESYLSVIDTTTSKVGARIPVPAPWHPRFITFSPDGANAYVSLFSTGDPKTGSGAVAVIDCRSGAVKTIRPIGVDLYAPAVSPDGRKVYVPIHRGAQLAVLDRSGATSTNPVQVKDNPHRIVFSQSTGRGYVADHESNLVLVLDPGTNRIVDEIDLGAGAGPHSLALTPDGRQAFVADFMGNAVSVVDTVKRSVIGSRIPVGQGPEAVAVAPDGRHAYVVDDGGNSVSVLDTGARKRVHVERVGGSPTSVSVLPNGTRAYVTNLDDGTVSILATDA